MIDHVEVRTAAGALLDLPLNDASSGLIVEDIGGLGPVKASIVSSSFAGLDGSQYQSSRRENRNITIRLALEPDYYTTSVRDLRTMLYRFFMTKSQVNLTFYMADGLVVTIDGRVESCEPVLFTNEPKVDISILCFDPDFLVPTPATLSGGTVSDTTETLVHYDGSIEAGITFTLNLNRSLSAFTIYHKLPDNSVRTSDFAISLASGDTFTFNTVSGNKFVTLVRSGVSTNPLYAMSPQSNWIELQPGDNYLRVYATGASIPYSVTYTPRYGGL